MPEVDDEGVVGTTAEQVLAVLDRVVDLPWSNGVELLEWEIDGLEGYTTWTAHVLPLAHRAGPATVAALAAPLASLADRRWGARHHFDATRHSDDASTDPASDDRRSTPAGLIRALGADGAVWWLCDGHAVVLVDSSVTAQQDVELAVLVMPHSSLRPPGEEEAALRSPLVEDFLSGDARRVISALWVVISTRDPEVLGPLVTALRSIEEATAHVDLGGALASNARHLEHALARVRLFADGACLCTAYPDHLMRDPVKEQQRGHVRVVGTVPNERQWEPDRICECVDCGRRYQVEQGEYHYPWWQWTPIARNSGR